MDDLIRFYFVWLDVGVGGWLVILVMCAVLAWWLSEDSQSRHLPDGLTWRWLVRVPLLFFAPTILCGLSAALSPQITLADANELSKPQFQLTALLGYLVLGWQVVICAVYTAWFWGQEGTLDGYALYNPNREVNPMTRFQAEELRRAGKNVSVSQLELSRQKIGVYADVALVSADYLENYPLREGINRIGRQRQNHIFLTDRSISREHAFIWCSQNYCVIYPYKDKQRALFVNNQPVQRGQSLREGDQLRFGLSPKVYYFVRANRNPR